MREQTVREMHALAQNKYVWNVNFKIDFCELTAMWSSDNIVLKPGKRDKIPFIQGRITVETDTGGGHIAQQEATKLVEDLLNACAFVSGTSLRITNVKPQPEKGWAYAPAISAPVTITAWHLVQVDDLNKSEELSQIVKRRPDKDIIDRIAKWFRRGIKASDVYDRFISMWVSFNAFYNHRFQPTGRPKWDRVERNRFLQLLKDLIDPVKAAEIINACKKECDQLTEAGIVSRDGRTNYSEELRKGIEAANHIKAIINAVNCIYGIRCDLFHGEKALTEDDKELVRSCCVFLNLLMRESILHYLQQR